MALAVILDLWSFIKLQGNVDNLTHIYCCFEYRRGQDWATCRCWTVAWFPNGHQSKPMLRVLIDLRRFFATNDKGNRYAHTNGELEFIAGDLICVAFGMVVQRLSSVVLSGDVILSENLHNIATGL